MTDDLIIYPHLAFALVASYLLQEPSVGEIYQVTPVKDLPFGVEKIAILEYVVKVDGTSHIPIMVANSTSTTIKISKREEVGKSVTANTREEAV